MKKSKIIIIVISVVILGTIGFFVTKLSSDKVAIPDGYSKSADCDKCGKTSCSKRCSASTGTSILNKIALSCNVKGTDNRIADEKWIRENIWNKMTSLNELATGYEMVFEKPFVTFAKELFDFMQKERQCCPTFSYALVFEPNGTIRYNTFDSKEVKEEMRFAFKELGLIK